MKKYRIKKTTGTYGTEYQIQEKENWFSKWKDKHFPFKKDYEVQSVYNFDAAMKKLTELKNYEKLRAKLKVKYKTEYVY